MFDIPEYEPFQKALDNFLDNGFADDVPDSEVEKASICFFAGWLSAICVAGDKILEAADEIETEKGGDLAERICQKIVSEALRHRPVLEKQSAELARRHYDVFGS